MTPRDHRRDDDAALTLAFFRYSLIAELVERDNFAPGERSAKVRELAALMHYQPGRGARRVSERTIYNWLRAYKKLGIDGLLPRFRRDRGISRVLDEETLQRAVQLRKEQPKRWTRILIDMLLLEGKLDSLPHRCTLDRHLRQRGASRRQLKTLGSRVHIKMKFDAFGDLWVGDYHHGPVILGPDGQPVTAKIGAFIDHFSRYPVADRYYLAENFASLRDCLLRALLIWGAPHGKVYVDRGSVYRAHQLAWALEQLPQRPKLVHSKPYYSEGRGLVERWWQLIKAFEAEVAALPRLLTIHELNSYWIAFRDRHYCNVVHSAIGRTPAQAVAEVNARPIDPDLVKKLFLVRVTRTVYKKTACVSVRARQFLCDSSLRGEKVQVRFDPNDLSSVLIYQDGKRLQRALPQPVNAKPEPHLDEPQKPTTSIEYLALIREEFDQQLLEHAKPLAYAQLRIDDHFDLDAFNCLLSELPGLKLRKAQRQEVAAFWETFGPLPESLVRIALEHALRLHGRGRHFRVYLHAIQTLVLAHWRNPKENQ
ncbi:MAG: DDE-type integrase/transposase/recombinase [Proteobacteria bacterium]|nr:DDE-type integrase/transposase/recombinase [Pseudomonadota bacterium]